MAKVVSFANQKGGVGKTTLCLQFAFYLGTRKKAKVLVLDMDAQGNSTSRLAPKDEDGQPILKGTKTAKLFADTIKKIQVIHCESGIDLIHTPKNDPDLYETEALPLDKALNPAKNLKHLFENYDYVLVDCPPSLGRNLVAALILSSHVVCPVRLSGFAVDGVAGLLSTIIGVREAYGVNLDIVGIVINAMDRSLNHERALRDLREDVPNLLFESAIRHRPPLDTATDSGVPVWKLSYGHTAAKEVLAVCEEIIRRMDSHD